MCVANGNRWPIIAGNEGIEKAHTLWVFERRASRQLKRRATGTKYEVGTLVLEDLQIIWMGMRLVTMDWADVEASPGRDSRSMYTCSVHTLPACLCEWLVYCRLKVYLRCGPPTTCYLRYFTCA